MKLYEAPSFVFNYAFNSVCAVFYDRYPNSFAKHVISEDVLSREITRDKIYTRKLIVKKGSSRFTGYFALKTKKFRSVLFEIRSKMVIKICYISIHAHVGGKHLR